CIAKFFNMMESTSMPVEHCGGVDEAAALVADDPLLFEPGTRHRDSIWGWVLVSGVVAGAAGKPFGRAMARQGVRAPRDDAYPRRGDRRPPRRSPVLHSEVGPGRPPRRPGGAAAGLLLSRGRRRVSAVERGYDRRLADADAAR